MIKAICIILLRDILGPLGESGDLHVHIKSKCFRTSTSVSGRSIPMVFMPSEPDKAQAPFYKLISLTPYYGTKVIRYRVERTIQIRYVGQGHSLSGPEYSLGKSLHQGHVVGQEISFKS